MPDQSRKIQISLNADVGEGLTSDEVIIPMVSSCSIACGGHCGDEDTMQKAVDKALSASVRIGAHPSFPDRLNFGREPMALRGQALVDELVRQIEALKQVVEKAGGEMCHVKPHGALYNMAVSDMDLAECVVDAVLAFGRHIRLYCPWRSGMADLAVISGLKVVFEAFVDRRYNADGSLVARTVEGAVIADAGVALQQVDAIARQQRTLALDGSALEIHAQTFCIHGDNPSALDILRHLHAELPKKGVELC